MAEEEAPEPDETPAASEEEEPELGELLAVAEEDESEPLDDFPAANQSPEESTAIMVETYAADPTEEPLEIGRADEEELNLGPIDIENLKVDLESSRLPEQVPEPAPKPVIRAKPMIKA